MVSKTGYFLLVFLAVTIFVLMFSIINGSESHVSEPAAEISGEEILQEKTDEWVSYTNHRDHFHPEYHEPGETVPDEIMYHERPGSGKFCMTLLNENNEPIVGNSLTNVTAVMDIEGLEWHELANPFEVKYPLRNHYDIPLDGDQFGTSDDLPQGNGILDSHCIEFHLEEANFEADYEPVEIRGNDSDRLEVVGYKEQIGPWDTDLDPVDGTYSYGESNYSNGNIAMNPNNSHFQVVTVLRLVSK